MKKCFSSLPLSAVSDVCLSYDGTPVAQRCIDLVADRCIEAWQEEDGGSGGAAPAALVLDSLFDTVLQKQVRRIYLLMPMLGGDSCSLFRFSLYISSVMCLMSFSDKVVVRAHVWAV